MNNQQRKALAVAVAGALALPASTIVQAQGLVLEEVIVTATRRAEGIQDIPYNITAVTGDLLQNVVASDLSKMSQFIPGMQMIDPGGRSVGLVTLRGLNVGALQASENQGGKDIISRYINDTPLLIDYKLIDIDRVEVLRGPQGTLYGRGAMGGTLRYILNRPVTDETTFEVNGRLYNYSESDDLSYDINAIGNLPITDNLALRVSGGYLDDTGFVDYPNVLVEPGVSNDTRKVEDANYEETISLRAALRWEPTDDLYLQLSYFLQDQEAGSRQAVNPEFTGDDFDSALRYEEPRDNKDQMINLEADWVTEYVEIFVTAAHSEYDGDGNRDQTDLLCVDIYPGYCNFPEFSAFTVEEAETDVDVIETRFLSVSDGPIDWIFGFYYEKEENQSSSKEFTPGYQDWAGIDTGWGELEYWNYADIDFEERAVFGELTWHITDNLQVTGGARYFEQEEKINFDCTLVPIFWFYEGIPIEPDCIDGKADIDDTVYKLNGSWNVTDDVMFYATWAEGFRRGGANLGPTSGQAALLPDERSYAPDKTENYELGWHTSWFDNRLILNGAIFHIVWSDLQVPTKSELGALNITRNGSEGEVDGFELSAQGAVTDRLSLGGWVTWYDHGLSEDAPEIDGFKGDPFPGVPDLQYNLSADYRFGLAAGEVTLRGNLYYKDEIQTRLNSEPPNDDNETLDDYTVVNLSATYEQDAWRVTLYADNVTDEYFYTGGRGPGRYGVQGQFYYVGQPRTLGLEFNYLFQ